MRSLLKTFAFYSHKNDFHLFLSANRCYHHRLPCNRFFFLLLENRNYRFFRIRLHLWLKVNGRAKKKNVMNVVISRICIQTDEWRRKKKWKFIFGNHKLHFKNEWTLNSSVNLTSHQFWLRWPPRLSETNRKKKEMIIKTWIVHTNVVDSLKKIQTKKQTRRWNETKHWIDGGPSAMQLHFTACQLGKINRETKKKTSNFYSYFTWIQSTSHVFWFCIVWCHNIISRIKEQPKRPNKRKQEITL